MQDQPDPPSGVLELVERSLDLFVTDITEALPKVLAGVVFLVIAGLLVKLVMLVVRRVLVRALPGEAPVYRQFLSTVVAVVLWFAVALSFLSVVGLSELAAALGTSAGFIALGVSYALSGMIADAVAGVYLLRDPDFNPGDEVTVGDVSGEVTTIELRKTRFAVDGDTVVRGNAEIEKKWTKRGEPSDASVADD
ncbi:mechanosensitive ion channel family protein [Haloarchaeobius baliensis]|uniref:mechanosensitive ion channel family protein n=1 Tax=Haloarchaeobius baliensis TaxID=1670458 RepID=UPI003F88274D